MASREEIADVFEKHVARFGYQKTTLDEVAADLHISKKTLYAHFDGKADIYRHVVERVARQSRSEISAAISGLSTCGEKLTGVVSIVISMARAHIGETSTSEWRAEFAVAEDAFASAFRSLLREIVEGGMNAGEFAIRDAALAERMIGAMVIEYTLMLRDDPKLSSDEELITAIRRFVG